jgi:hypothetical protein
MKNNGLESALRQQRRGNKKSIALPLSDYARKAERASRRGEKGPQKITHYSSRQKEAPTATSSNHHPDDKRGQGDDSSDPCLEHYCTPE